MRRAERLLCLCFVSIGWSCAQPAEETCPAGIELEVTLPCCDAHDAQASVTYPSGSVQQYAPDTSAVLGGGTIDQYLPFPDAVTAGTAQIAVYADGDGTEMFASNGDATITPGACARVALHATSTHVDVAP